MKGSRRRARVGVAFVGMRDGMTGLQEVAVGHLLVWAVGAFSLPVVLMHGPDAGSLVAMRLARAMGIATYLLADADDDLVQAFPADRVLLARNAKVAGYLYRMAEQGVVAAAYPPLAKQDRQNNYPKLLHHRAVAIRNISREYPRGKRPHLAVRLPATGGMEWAVTSDVRKGQGLTWTAWPPPKSMLVV